MTHHIRSMMTRYVAAPILAAGLVGAALLPAAAAEAPAPGEWLTLEEMGFAEPTPSQAQERIVAFGDAEPVVFGTDGSIEELQTTEEEDGEQVISLSSDILFAPDEWELPDRATAKLEELLTDVPDVAALAVHGHTDSVQGEVENTELSQNRAEAVAGAVADVRADLDLDVKGFADAKPKEEEGGSDEEEARAANRRVELRYG